MKKIVKPLFALGLMLMATSCGVTKNAANVEVVNEKTVILKDVDKIEIAAKNNRQNQATWVYDLDANRLVKVARGSFAIEVNKGKYLVQSEGRIAKASYEIAYADEETKY